MSDYFLHCNPCFLLLYFINSSKAYLLNPSWLTGTACMSWRLYRFFICPDDWFFKGMKYYIVDLILLFVSMIDYGDRGLSVCSVPGEGEGGRAPGQSLQEGFHLVRQSASQRRDVSPGLFLFCCVQCFLSPSTQKFLLIMSLTFS